ncbi:MAG: class I SAM-dependent methyltransferase [Candidatus Omnitrophota bacterium]|jgi:SAM-dependent methyltransferase
MKNLLELTRAVKILGLNHLLKVRKIKKITGDIVGGFFLTRVMSTLLNANFFNEFSKNMVVDIHLFSKDNSLDEKTLGLLCDYLSSLKILKEKKPGYCLTAKGKFISEMGSGLFDIVYSFEGILHNLEPILKNEKTISRDSARLYFEAKGTGDAAKLLVFPIIIDTIKKNNFKRIFDIGCGSAAFLIELCKNIPEASGYGIDLSAEAILHGQKQIIKNYLGDKIELFAGNILTHLELFAEKINNADIVTASFVLHELFLKGKEQIIDFLAKFRNKFKNKYLLVCENIEQTPNELRKNPGLYSELQLVHRLIDEQQMSRKDWREVFQKSGFEEIIEQHLAFAKISIYILH